ncbi:hypothetical protein Ancab_011523 [Ancistrocladus abbreviatus]
MAMVPMSTCMEMELATRRFIWGCASKRKKEFLISWDRVCQLKEHGGLGLDKLVVLDFTTDSGEWDWLKLGQSIPPWCINLIACIVPFAAENGENKLLWRLEANGTALRLAHLAPPLASGLLSCLLLHDQA